MIKQVVVEGVLSSYIELNSNAKRTMIVLHGWGHDAGSWLNVMIAMPKDFRYILFDLPGFGGTRLLGGVPDVPEYAEFVQSFAKKIGVKSAWFLGHSFGGQISTYLSINFPSLVEKMVLVSPAIIRTKSLRDKIKIFIFKQFGLIKSMFPKKMVEWVLKKVTATDYYNSSKIHREILKKIVNYEQKDVLGKVASPTLLLWGEKDSAIAYEGKNIAESIPNCRLKVLYGVGHNVHLHKPEILVDEISRYLRIR